MGTPTCTVRTDDRAVTALDPEGTSIPDALHAEAGAAARVADDLQSDVVSRLFTAGLSASSLAARYQHDPQGRDHALAIITELDAAIATLRAGILDLRDFRDRLAGG